MALYIEFFKKAFQERYAFKFNFYISILASVLILVIQMNVWTALYGSKSEINNVHFGEMINYIIIATIVMVLTKSGAGKKMAARVENGNIIFDLMRPINFKRYLLSEDLGTNLFQISFVTLPAIFVTWLMFSFDLKVSTEHIVLFLVSLFLAILIAYHVHYIFGLFAFWLETSWYISFFIGAMLELFSGSVVPLWFYPNWLNNICQLLPFRFIFFEPISIFLGKYEFVQALNLIILQLGWLIVFIAIERYIWSKVQKKLVIHGG